MRIIKHMEVAGLRLDQRYREVVKRHMIIGFFILFAVIPVFILFSVAVITMAIIFPLLSVS